MKEKSVKITGTDKNIAGWEFFVQVKIKNLDSGKTSEYNIEIQLDDIDYARLTNRTITPEEMVIKSIKFLLRRESADQIKKSFNLTEIKKYFPDWEEMIKP